MNENNVNQVSKNNNVQTNNGGVFLTLIVFGIMIFLGWKFFVQPVFFPSNVQENGWEAEYYAKIDLGKNCSENELTVKAIEENNGIYIVKCTTTNTMLKGLYGSTFYYGYKPNAAGTSYQYHIDTSIGSIYSKLK